MNQKKMGSDPISVAHVITRMIVGGAQENTLDSVLGLAALPGYDLTLITGPERGPEGDLLALCDKPLPRVIVVPFLLRNLSLWRDIAAFFSLWRLFRKERFDIVHTHSSKAGILGRWAASLAGVPLIVHTVHGLAIGHSALALAALGTPTPARSSRGTRATVGPYHDRLWNWIFHRVEKWAARRTDVLICVSHSLVQECKRLGLEPRGKTVMIPSGFDWSWFEDASVRRQSIRKQLGLGATDVLAVKVARFFPLKGHDIVFQVLDPLLSRQPSLKFLFVGDGVLRFQYEQIVRQKGWSGRVIFSGLVPPRRVAEMIAASDFLVHASAREGLARVIPQAFACKIPVVALEADGAGDLVRDGSTGFLIGQNNGGALQDAIEILSKDPVLRQNMGIAGHQLVKGLYPVARMIQSLDKIYREAFHA